MEKISKIFALTVDRIHGGTGEGGNCKVVAFNRNNEFIQDPDTINSYFTTNSMIFSNRIYTALPDLTNNQLVELTVKNFINEVDEGKNIYVGFNSVKKAGNIVIDIPSDYIQENYIDLPQINKYLELNKYLDRDLGYFYLCDTLNLYGPFRISNNVIQPKVGKHVNSFEYIIDDLIEIEGCDFSYIIEDPKNKFGVIDCMSDHQLIDFLKEQLTIDRAEINLIKKTAEQIAILNQGRMELDAKRLSRAANVLGSLIFSYNELKRISQKDHDWSQLIKKVIEDHKGEIREEAINEIEAEILKKNSIKDGVLKEISAKRDELKKLNEDIEVLSKQYDKIQQSKEDLILAIQIAAGSNHNKSEVVVEEKKQFFEILKADNPSEIEDFDEFYDQFVTKPKNKKELKETLYILKEKKFVVGNSAELLINAIQHIGSYRIMLQNVEVDWLKYSYLEQNGFSGFTTDALLNPHIPFFFILQDFNIASFECYGKPITDVVKGIRKNIPGTNYKWPENLYFILVTSQSDIEGFGFELNLSTLSNWHFLPAVENYIIQKIDSQRGINLKKLEVHDNYSNNTEYYLS